MIPVGDDAQYESWPYNQIGTLYSISADINDKNPEFVKTNAKVLVPKQPNPIGFIWS